MNRSVRGQRHDLRSKLATLHRQLSRIGAGPERPSRSRTYTWSLHSSGMCPKHPNVLPFTSPQLSLPPTLQPNLPNTHLNYYTVAQSPRNRNLALHHRHAPRRGELLRIDTAGLAGARPRGLGPLPPGDPHAGEADERESGVRA